MCQKLCFATFATVNLHAEDLLRGADLLLSHEKCISLRIGPTNRAALGKGCERYAMAARSSSSVLVARETDDGPELLSFGEARSANVIQSRHVTGSSSSTTHVHSNMPRWSPCRDLRGEAINYDTLMVMFPFGTRWF